MERELSIGTLVVGNAVKPLQELQRRPFPPASYISNGRDNQPSAVRLPDSYRP